MLRSDLNAKIKRHIQVYGPGAEVVFLSQQIRGPVSEIVLSSYGYLLDFWHQHRVVILETPDYVAILRGGALMMAYRLMVGDVCRSMDDVQECCEAGFDLALYLKLK